MKFYESQTIIKVVVIKTFPGKIQITISFKLHKNLGFVYCYTLFVIRYPSPIRKYYQEKNNLILMCFNTHFITNSYPVLVSKQLERVKMPQ